MNGPAMDLPIELPQPQWEALRAAHATPPRAYHGFAHVQDVLRRYGEVAAGPGWRRPREVLLAVLYHDAVYVPGARDNEARSAQLAREHIERWLPAAGIDADRVGALIGMTARHGSLEPADFDEQDAGDAEDARLFLDCDMAILGAEAAAFDAYDRGIAAEYRGHVPDWLFRINRRRFLKALLGRQRIFLSDFFHARLDARARANLRRAVTSKR